jgi:predicted ATPase
VIHRISLTGAQGTGKSTLARAIADRLLADGRDVALHAGLGGQVARYGHATGALASSESVRTFVRMHRDREAASEKAVQVFDRCLLDALAYAHVLACLPGDELEDLRLATIASCARLTRLLWLRVTVDYPVLGAADESPAFRRAIDGAIGYLARDYGIMLVEHAIPPDRPADIARTLRELVGQP